MIYKSIAKIVFMVVLCCGVGLLGGLSTRNAVTGWYAALTRPPLNPPSWAFGVVWPILYVLMGIAAGLVWNRGWANSTVKLAMILFGIQLLLNGIWTPLFFGQHWIGVALIEIVVLWLTLAATVLLFRPVSVWASVLPWPYLAWVTFAVYLNAGYWVLNHL